METEAQKLYTPEEYFALEASSEIRHEYYRGEIFAMAGRSVNHNRIVRNILTNFASSLPGECEAFAIDLRVRIEASDLFTYPDLTIVCGKIDYYENRTDTILNPLAIIEVLSKTTEGYDRGKKFELYRTIASLREYVLVDQSRYHIEQFYIGKEGKWVLTEYTRPEEALHFNHIGMEIALAEIYRRVEFETVDNTQ